MKDAWLAIVLCAAPIVAAPLPAAPATAASFRDRLAEDEIVYFLLPDRFDNAVPGNDRGGISGDRLQTGFDPAAKGFYHGGDLEGLIRRLDYIRGLGATAVWVAPVFENKPVQGAKGEESAGYHGYWVTDFTRVDPHFGRNADFAALVAAAHGRGLKVYMDIIANHTADVIQYRECTAGCAYRSVADFPWWQNAGTGAPINAGFAGPGDDSAGNFARLTDSGYAYTPFVPPAAVHLKKPEWLNNPIHYHNRGNSTFAGESATLGDFVGLDDLMTEDPAVVQGFIDIYGGWIDRFGIDGFRIDTAKHVDPAFWQQFVPAMLARARSKGIPNFHVFGEVYSDSPDAGVLAAHTRVDKLPSVLDFAFRRAVVDTAGGVAGTDELAVLFAGDALYEGGEDAALRLPTFLGNHDAGRFGFFARKALPHADDAEVLQREMLANAMLFGLRGVPVVYAGDEQGFAGDGGDQDAREDQFGSHVASYNDNRLLGTTATTATPRFDTAHPLYRQIAALAAVRAASPALRRGRQVTRASGDKPGLFAVSRFNPDNGAETLLAFNTSAMPITTNIAVAPGSTAFRSLAGTCPATASAVGRMTITLPPFGYAFCSART